MVTSNGDEHALSRHQLRPLRCWACENLLAFHFHGPGDEMILEADATEQRRDASTSAWRRHRDGTDRPVEVIDDWNHREKRVCNHPVKGVISPTSRAKRHGPAEAHAILEGSYGTEVTMQFRRKGSRIPKRSARTTVSFSREDLAVLAQLLQAGQVLLTLDERPPLIARLKAAMTRLKVPVPHGL